MDVRAWREERDRLKRAAAKATRGQTVDLDAKTPPKERKK